MIKTHQHRLGLIPDNIEYHSVSTLMWYPFIFLPGLLAWPLFHSFNYSTLNLELQFSVCITYTWNIKCNLLVLYICSIKKKTPETMKKIPVLFLDIVIFAVNCILHILHVAHCITQPVRNGTKWSTRGLQINMFLMCESTKNNQNLS